MKNVPQSPALRASLFTPERGELINLLYILASYLQTHPGVWDPSQTLRHVCPFVLGGDLTSDQFCCDCNIRCSSVLARRFSLMNVVAMRAVVHSSPGTHSIWINVSCFGLERLPCVVFLLS